MGHPSGERCSVRSGLGSTLLPFRLLDPWLGIISWDGSTLLDSANPHLDAYPGLAEWWTRAENSWEEDKGENRLTFLVVVSSSPGSPLRRAQKAHRALRGLGIAKDVIVTTADRFDRMKIVEASLEHEVATEGPLLYG